MRLREAEKLTHREIAARMGVTHHRIRQVLAATKARLQDCAAHGEGALSLLPKRVRDLLEWADLASPAALRLAIETKRLAWDVPRQRIMLDGKYLRIIGWQSWQLLCEWAGLPRPTSLPKRGRR